MALLSGERQNGKRSGMLSREKEGKAPGLGGETLQSLMFGFGEKTVADERGHGERKSLGSNLWKKRSVTKTRPLRT